MIDRSDCICLAGASFMLAGVAAIYWPLALILFGFLVIGVGAAMARKSEGK